MTPGRTRGLGMAAALVAFATAVGLQIARDATYAKDAAQDRALLYVRSPEALRRILLSFDALAADVYWIRALQHYGGDRLDKQKIGKYELLYPLLDLTTSLDPNFTIAYRFGAIFLSEAYPGGAGRPDLAVNLLRKAVSAQPRKWQYYHDIGFVYYWQLRDTQAAANWFRMAASQPGAPDWLEPLAANMLIEGGDRASARVLLNEILKSDEAWLRDMAARALMQMEALDRIDQLQRFVTANPMPSAEPYSWESYMRQGKSRIIPQDPSGVPFAIDAVTGTVTVSPASPLYPMPTRRELR